MNTARALTVLAVAGVVGGGLGLTAHAVTGGDPTSPTASAQHSATHAPATTRPTPTGSSASPTATTPATPTGSAAPTSGAGASSSSSGQLGLRNLVTQADLTAANVSVKAGSYQAGDANDFQYAITPCMRSSLGELTGANSYQAEAYGDGSAFVGEVVSAMTSTTQARTAAAMLVRWHSGTCPNGGTFTPEDTESAAGGTIWTFTSDRGEIVGIIRVGARLAVVDVSHEPSAATAENVFQAAARRLASPR
jgi:hypothetical protein